MARLGSIVSPFVAVVLVRSCADTPPAVIRRLLLGCGQGSICAQEVHPCIWLPENTTRSQLRLKINPREVGVAYERLSSGCQVAYANRWCAPGHLCSFTVHRKQSRLDMLSVISTGADLGPPCSTRMRSRSYRRMTCVSNTANLVSTGPQWVHDVGGGHVGGGMLGGSAVHDSAAHRDQGPRPDGATRCVTCTLLCLQATCTTICTGGQT